MCLSSYARERHRPGDDPYRAANRNAARRVERTSMVVDRLGESKHRDSAFTVRLRGRVNLTKEQPRDTDDQPFNAHRMACRIARIRKKAGLRKIGWHTLRHTFASHLVMRGVP